MSQNTVLLQLKSLTLNHETEAAPDVVEAIKNNILGNPDGIRYRHLDSLQKITDIKPLLFFTLRRDSNLLYVMALVERITKLKNKHYYTYNVRYVIFNQLFTAKTLTSENKPNGFQKIGNSIIKEGMRKHAENFKFTLKDESANPEKKLYYSYVEESNLRSMNFTQFFFESIRNISVITCSHVFPKIDKCVSKIKTEELSEVCSLIRETYANHSFFFINENDILSNYYVVKTGDKIVAGVKAETANWKFEQLPGKGGKFLIKALPYLPVISRIIKPKRFSFLTFDTIYCPEGNEKYLSKLFESVCALTKVYSAMIYLDKGDELYPKINQLKKMGILNKLFKNANGVVLARFVNFSDEEKEEYYNSPAYLSGYDMT